MNEKIINYIKQELDNQMKFCLKSRKNYDVQHEMFHFYTGAISYLKDMYETICKAQALQESEEQ